MKTLNVKRVSSDAKLPTRNLQFDAGLDLYSNVDVFLSLNSTNKVPTGISIAVPEGYYAQIADRSSLAVKGLRTGAGVVDCGFQGEITVVLHNLTHNGDFGGYLIKKGDRIAQLVFHKIELPEVVEVDSFPDSERGQGAFGSSGR